MRDEEKKNGKSSRDAKEKSNVGKGDKEGRMGEWDKEKLQTEMKRIRN